MPRNLSETGAWPKASASRSPISKALMVWRAAVDGEARMVVGRGGFFCFLRGALSGGLAGRAVVPSLPLAGLWDCVSETTSSARTPRAVVITRGSACLFCAN